MVRNCIINELDKGNKLPDQVIIIGFRLCLLQSRSANVSFEGKVLIIVPIKQLVTLSEKSRSWTRLPGFSVAELGALAFYVAFNLS